MAPNADVNTNINKLREITLSLFDDIVNNHDKMPRYESLQK